MQIQNNQNQYHTSFGKFIKVTGKPEKIALAKDMLWSIEKPHISLTKKGAKKDSLYIISGKDFSKFIELTKNIYFRELRTNLEKYMPVKPKSQKISSLLKKLKNENIKL